MYDNEVRRKFKIKMTIKFTILGLIAVASVVLTVLMFKNM